MSESEERDHIPDEEMEQALVDIENVGDQSKAFDALINGYIEREDMDNARRIRNMFRRTYSLSEDQWLDWITDEICNAETEEDKRSIEKLCQYAIKDVYSVDVWKEYCEHCCKVYPNDDKKIVDLYEEAVNTIGNNLVEGKEIWESYINYLKTKYSNQKDENQKSNLITQIRNIYLRQFAIPLKGNEESYEEYVQWENEIGKGDVNEAMIKLTQSQSEFEKRVPYEDAITKAVMRNDEEESNNNNNNNNNGAEKLPVKEWKEYIEYIKNNSNDDNNEEEVIRMYERATSSEVRKDESIWNDYINCYLTYKNFDKKYFLSLLKRACRVLLKPIYFIYYINYNELYNDEYLSFIESFISTIMKYNIFYSSEISQILLEVIHSFTSYYKTNQKKLDKEKNEEQFGRLLEQILSYMESHHFDKLYDRYSLYKYSAIFYSDVYDDKDSAEKCWNNLGELFNTSSYFYIDYLNWLKTLINRNDNNEEEKNKYINQCKNVISTVVNKVQLDDYKTFYDFWRDFEYQYGDINSLLLFHSQSQPSYEYWLKQMIEMEKTKEMENEKYVGLGKKKESNSNNNKSKGKKERKQKQKPQQQQQEKKKQKRKMSDSVDNKSVENPKKKQRVEEKETTPEKMEIEEEEDNDNNNHEEEDIKNDNKDNNTEPKQEQDEEISEDVAERSTIFIKNLSFKTTEEEISKHFEKCGKISQVRLILNARGSSRGIAYVDFESSDCVREALKLNRSILNDRVIIVQRSLPPGEREDVSGPSEKQSHPKTIFIRKLTTNTNEEMIIKEFERFGKVNRCQLVRDKNNKSKGYALLEFEESESVEKSINENEIELNGSKLSVCRSRYGINDKEEIKKKKEEELEKKFAQHKKQMIQLVPLSVKTKKQSKK